MKKCIIVIGPESTGSKLIAKIIAHVLDIKPFGDWNGTGWCDGGHHKVYHRSLPYDLPPKFPDIPALIGENRNNFDISFILTTRDITISEISRNLRWGKGLGQVRKESARAREIMTEVMNSGLPGFIWSYETFIFLGKHYLDRLYSFVGLSSDFIPELADGNRSKINSNIH